MAVVQELFQIPSLVTLLVSVLVLLILYLLINTQNRGKEPPGPRPLPLLGNLLQLDLKTLHLSLFQLSQKYGPVYTIHFGPKKTVVVAGYQAVKEALINLGEEFGDREIPPVFKDYAKGHGIVFANGDSWKEMRRFALSTLRDFGMGKRGSEEKIVEEIHYLTEVFENFKGSPFDNTEELMHTTCNIISSIIYGDRFDYEDPHFQEMVTQTKRNVQLMASPGVLIYDMFPWLGWWLKDRKVLMEGFKFTLTQIKQMIGKLRETLNLEERRGFVDSFLIHQQKIKKSREKVSAYYHDENLLMSVANLFAAGTDTTANTLRWGLLLMAKYPHVQDRVQEELDRVIGGRQTRVEDRKNLPYTDAVIHEIQRVAQVTPLVRHSTSCDVVLQGYSIKKGTAVTLLLSSVLSDESEWESPNTFNPGHFLDDQGLFKKRDAFMPFSAGRRLCIGESLARMEIFLFFTTLLQRFHFTPPPGVSVSDLDLTPVFGFTVSPTPHTLCAQPRVRS
ncbi:cytochrome P450 2K1-like isoform X1 [Brienomyrus brachyistius]|uniref:cytochrome P450 2K1-like isoform X1 n=1 Tax=Brienomyrus brachyistius TaxID=42636 RepID=UPI0020B353CB|nr:cytochrome P450 2K1-like isoform X1 [Brienomyrus brachyistius]